MHPALCVQRRATLALLIALVSGTAATAHAQTGVSDDRVSLPDGPGSIDGIGDNVSVTGNMGAMTYSLPFELPQGHPGATPSLSLSYSSTSGSSIAGIGWALDVPSIERSTLRGLPEYDADDEIVADGSEQLVRVSQRGADATFRARFERDFVRYTWHDAGAQGHWEAEYPDGRRGYFGADSTGTLVPEARVTGERGETFRYLLAETVDPHGHRVRFRYRRSDTTSLLARIEWLFRGEEPFYSVELGYEPRADLLSDCDPGFEERITERLVSVQVRAGAEIVRRYRLTYEEGRSMSRLVRVERFGRRGGAYPVVHSFTYSRGLVGVCADCERPFVVDMGTLGGGVSLRSGEATLVDIDGDGLPDLVDTSGSGPHRFYRNVLEREGHARFESVPVESRVATGSELRTGLPYVQVLDLDGNGFADMVNGLSLRAVCNDGSGDWVREGCAALGSGGLGVPLEDDPGESGEADPLRTRFMDLDADRRIDVLRTVGAGEVQARLNTPDGFVAITAEPLGRELDRDHLQFADINGDGLLDPTVIDPDGLIRYRLHLGRARWTEWRTAEGPRLASGTDQELAELEDLDGDGLDDLVIVSGATLRYALNRSGGRFDALSALDASMIEGGLPLRSDTTTIVFADMNGNGSSDVVWVETTGRARYLELFPVRPNLLSMVENGLGLVHRVEYATSAHQRAISELEWRYPSPGAPNVVSRTDTWVTISGSGDGSGLHEIVEHVFADAYYDGLEHRFAGFARVEHRYPGDDSQEAGRVVEEYDVGAEDRYRAGLLLRTATLAGALGDERPLLEERIVHQDCELAEIPRGTPVRHLCERERTTIVQEGEAPEAWITTRTDTRYDGYGQIVRRAEHGVVHRGPPEMPSACEPCAELPVGTSSGACGAECLGDERITETEHIEPGERTGGLWLLGAALRQRTSSAPGGPAAETRTYYDGSDFQGLALGRLTRGVVTRVARTVRVGDEETIDVERHALDAHGNVIATLDPLGAPDDHGGHRRDYAYDADGLRVVRTAIALTSPEGVPYRLVQGYGYDEALGVVVESSGWTLEGLGASSADPTRYEHDEHARLAAIIEPGDTADAPTIEIAWELDEPASRVVMRRRRGGSAGDDAMLEVVRCIDGRGRELSTRTRVRDGEWLVSGFTERNRRGAVVREHAAYTDRSGLCGARPPEGTPITEIRYDALGRELERTLPDAGLRGGEASRTRIVRRPLSIERWDANDLDDTSEHRGTPDVTHLDGLARPIGIERLLREDGAIRSARTALLYDALGRLGGYVDAEGRLKTQHMDALGRVLRVDDPASGATELSYDDAGNLRSRTDARGVTTHTSYDGANRPVATWDADDPEGTRTTIRYDVGAGCEPGDCERAEGQWVEARYPLPSEIAGALRGEPVGIDRVARDARGREVRRTRTLAGHRFATEHRFDGAGRERETRYPDGTVIARRFDDASRLVEIEGLIEAVEHDVRGRLSRVVRADGGEDVLAYDDRSLLVSLDLVAGDGGEIARWSYERDREGHPTRVTDRAAREGGGLSGDALHRYDAWYRLVSSELDVGTDAAETLSLAWDDTDGLRSVRSSRGEASASHVGDYARDRGGRTERAGERVRVHDAAGFLVGHGAMTLAWDHLGRLSSAVDETRSEVVAYGFEGTRVASLGEGGLVLYVDPDVEIRDGLASVYARIGARRVARVRSTQLATELVADLDADGAIDVRDAWLARGGADELALRAAARRLLHDAAPEPTQLYADALGSLIAATREGEIVGRRALSPLGAVRRERGFVDAHAFTGQELDAATGLYVFDHRLLDPSAGLWTSADPAFEAVSSELDRAPEMANRYAYVLGQVTSSVDPDGLMRDRARGRARRAGAWLRSRRRLVRVGQNVAVWGAQGFMYLGLSNTTSQGVRIASGLGGTLAVIGTAATRTYLRYRDLNQRARGMTQHVLRAVRDTFSDVTVGGITSLGLSMVTQLGSSSGLTSEYFASTGFLSLVGGTVVGALGWLGTELAANARSDASLSTEEGASEVGSGPVDLSDVQVEQ